MKRINNDVKKYILDFTGCQEEAVFEDRARRFQRSQSP